MVSAVNISLQFGDRRLLQGVTFFLGPHDRVALVGANGTGKSTLLRILLGTSTPDSGAITRAKYVTAGYLPQEGTALSGRTLYAEVESVFSDILETRAALEEVHVAMAAAPPGSDVSRELLEIYGELQHKLEASDSFRIPSAIEKVLTGLGFVPADLTRLTEEFSGGWQMRIALARLLLMQPSLLLLDEPTNHLDLDSLQWLEEYLQSYRGAVMIVSHDRRFLDTMTTRTFELSGGSLVEYAGNFSFSQQAREERRIRLQAAYRNQQDHIKQTERFIERFRYKATKARQVQSRIKQLEKLDRVDLEEDEDEISFSFPPAPPSGKVMLELRNISKRYGPLQVFDRIHFTVDRGDRIAFVGVNGAGKSTLGRIIAGVEPFDGGERVPGHNLVVSYFAQHQAEELTPSFDVLQTVETVAAGDVRTRLRTLLGCFLFSGDDVFKKVSVLSGGEKSRLALAKMLLLPANLIVLDEPTNHLDMRSKSVLQEALVSFGGSLVVVSHDRDFLDPLVNKVVEFKAGRIRTFLGTVSDYLAARAREEAAAVSPATTTRPSTATGERERKRREAEVRQERYEKTKPLQHRLAVLEKSIAKQETRKKALEEQMIDPETYKGADHIREINAAYREAGQELDGLYWEWSRLTDELAAVQAHYDAERERQ